MANKYCKKLHPVIAIGRGASAIWKRMLTVRELVEHQILWQIRRGESSFWFENWTSLGALYHVFADALNDEEIQVRKFAENKVWNETLLA